MAEDRTEEPRVNRFSPARGIIGSLFSGIGGLDLAAEWSTGGCIDWQIDLTGAKIRRRHWPDAMQFEMDARHIDIDWLPPVDTLVAGFPCQDFSVARPAARRAAPPDEKCAMFRLTATFIDALQPRRVLLENVPSAFRDPVIANTLAAIGYRLFTATVEARDVGLPHKRARTFAVAVPGSGAPVNVTVAPRVPPSHTRLWPTPVARDDTTGEIRRTPGCGENLSTAASSYGRGRTEGSRLNPAWVERLMGFPEGWTEPEGPPLTPREVGFPGVRGRYPRDWDRSRPWPGLPDEPPRVLPPGPPVRGRAARIRALGNAVCPPQGAHAFRALLNIITTLEVS